MSCNNYTLLHSYTSYTSFTLHPTLFTLLLHAVSVIMTEYLIIIIHVLHFFHTSLALVAPVAPQYTTCKNCLAITFIIITLLQNVHCYTLRLLHFFYTSSYTFYTSITVVTEKALIKCLCLL